MLRIGVKHLDHSEESVKVFSLGNGYPNLGKNNTAILWFDVSKIYKKYPFHICLHVNTTFYHRDLHGSVIFTYYKALHELVDDISSNYYDPYEYIICNKSNSLARYYTEIIFDRVNKKLGIKLVLLNNPAFANLYIISEQLSIINFMANQKHKVTKIEYSLTENYNELPNMVQADIKYSISDKRNNVIIGYVQSLNVDKTFILSGIARDFTANKSIAIPRWVDYVEFIGTGINSSDYNQASTSSGLNVPSFAFTPFNDGSQLYSVPNFDFSLISVENNTRISFNESTNGNTAIGNTLYASIEDICIYDGCDMYYWYYHIEHRATKYTMLNNYIRIIGSVKKKFRVLCYKIHKILNYIHNFNHIKSFPYKNYEIGGDLIC